jgi:hypothetical protein
MAVIGTEKQMTFFTQKVAYITSSASDHFAAAVSFTVSNQKSWRAVIDFSSHASPS